MIKMKRNEMILTAVAVLLIGSFLLQKFILPKKAGKAKGALREIALQESDLKMGIEIQKRKDAIVEDAKKYKEYIRSDTLPEADRVAEFLKDVEVMAKEAGVSIVSLSPRAQSPEEAASKKYYADLRVEANFEQIVTFLAKIETSKTLIKTEKLTIAPKDEMGNVIKLDTTLSIAVF